jgi:hypothetical protein
MGDAGRLTVFHGLRAPPISIDAYVERLAMYTKCSPICFVFALDFMATLARAELGLQPITLNVHRLLLTSTMLAAKFTDDRYYNNAFYSKVRGAAARGHRSPPATTPQQRSREAAAAAMPRFSCCCVLPPLQGARRRPPWLCPPMRRPQVGGITLAEINRLEKEMLRLLDYKLYMSPEALVVAYRALESGTVVTEGFLGQGQQQQQVAGWGGAAGKKRRSMGEALAGEERPATRRTLGDASPGCADCAGCDCMDTD